MDSASSVCVCVYQSSGVLNVIGQDELTICPTGCHAKQQVSGFS